MKCTVAEIRVILVTCTVKYNVFSARLVILIAAVLEIRFISVVTLCPVAFADVSENIFTFIFRTM